MKNYSEKIQNSNVYRLYKSFSPSTKAAILLGLPYLLVDAIHYFTAGTALVFSWALLIFLFMYCGMLAAKIGYRTGIPSKELPRHGFLASSKLWVLSTILNSLVALLAGTASLGVTMLLSIPYLVLCTPFIFIVSGVCGWTGAILARSYYQRVGG